MKGAKGKKPTREFYFKDWLGDRRLQASSSSTRGIWMNLLCCMWDDGELSTGELIDMSLEEIGRLGRASPQEVELFLTDAERHEFCDLVRNVSTKCPSNVSIISRRIQNELKQRKQWAEQKRVQRSKGPNADCPTDVQPSRARSPSSSPSTVVGRLPKGNPSSTVYSGNHWHQKIGEFFSSIRSLRDEIAGFDENRCAEFNVDSWIQQQVSKAAHPGCIEHCLTALVRMSKSKKVTKPFGFLKHVHDRENGNFNEADAIAMHEELKAMPVPDLQNLTEGMLKSVE